MLSENIFILFEFYVEKWKQYENIDSEMMFTFSDNCL
jgi:hypothetical protein